MQLRFLFLDESRGAYFLKQADGEKRVSAAPYSISQPVNVSLGQPLEILRAKSSRKNDARQKILTLNAPRQGTSALVVVQPDASNASSYDYVILETGSEDKTPQTLRVFNLGVSDTAIVIGDAKAQLAAGNTTLLKLNPDAKHRVIAKVGEKTQDGWRMLYDGVIALRPEQMMTAVIVYSPTGMRHTYTEQEIIEFGEPEPGHFWLTYVE